MKRPTNSALLDLGAGSLSGLMLTAAFPAWDMAWLAWVALVPLLARLGQLQGRRAFRLGVITGLVHYLSLCYWLVQTMQTYGGLPPYLSIPLFFLLAAYLSLYTGIFALAANRLSPRPAALFLLVPFLWTAVEYLRSFLFSGFPWELLGYAHYNALHIIQISDIFGVYGVSFLTALVNAAAALVVLRLGRLPWRGCEVRTAVCLAATALAAVALGSTLLYGRQRLATIDAWAAASPTVKVAVAQGNVDQAIKWDPAFREATTERYIVLTKTAAARDHAQLVVWPETAAPFYFQHDVRLTQEVLAAARDAGVTMIVGSPTAVRDGEAVAFYNSAYLIAPDGSIRGRYDKAHLVPFGEYVPLKRYLPFIGKIVAQVGDFRSGPAGLTLAWSACRLGMLICYEAIFPDLAREMARNGAGLLVNITNDAWYGRSSAPYQHFSMAVFRAVENRRTLVRSANTGISGFVDPTGRILQASPLFVEALLAQETPVLQQQTTYTRFGDAFAFACLLVALAAAAFSGLQAVIKRR